MNTHTKGPWKVYDANSDTMHVGTISTTEGAGWKYETICNMYDDASDNYDTFNNFELFKNAKQNAHLITCAPDLLYALDLLVNGSPDPRASMAIARGILSRTRAELAP